MQLVGLCLAVSEAVAKVTFEDIVWIFYANGGGLT
jgi:hypothetical protein